MDPCSVCVASNGVISIGVCIFLSCNKTLVVVVVVVHICHLHWLRRQCDEFSWSVWMCVWECFCEHDSMFWVSLYACVYVCVFVCTSALVHMKREIHMYDAYTNNKHTNSVFFFHPKKNMVLNHLFEYLLFAVLT